MRPAARYDNPEAYIAGDRRRALAAGTELPDRVHGAALFADISGFTPLTEALVAEYGAQRGAEELSAVLDRLFEAVLGHLHARDGSVVYFSGDAVTCWLDGDDGTLATGCALAMQQEMITAGVITLPSGTAARLAMKVAVAVGPARRFVVGDHLVQLIDVLAGSLMDRLAEAEHHATAGEVVLDETAMISLGDRVRGTERSGDHHRRYLVVRELVETPVVPPMPAEAAPLPDPVVRQWLLPAVYERMRTGRGEFLAELRTAVPLFLRFGGVDYDTDPDAEATLDAFIVAAQRIVDGYGGSTLQLTLGDKGCYLYAVFGTPLAHEDDTARACAAALELLTLSEDHPVTGLQIGLARGRVRSGTYGHEMRRTFCCLGDPVNLAARLMTAAPVGEIYASAAVRDAAGPSFEWNSLAEQHLKGKALPVTAYALRAADRQTAATRHRRHTLPMIGRDDELAVLDRHIVETADGRGQVVAITAGAGLGKSRLLVEGARLLSERGIRAYEGEAPAFGTRASYAAWHQVWAGLLDLPGQLSSVEQRELLHDRVQGLDPDLLPRLPLLGAPLGLAIPDNELTASLGAKLRKASLEALLGELLARLATTGPPIAIMIEDAQWLDPLSADLLLALAQASTTLPVLFLVAHRSAAENDAVAPLRTLPHFSEIPLGELDADSCRQIVITKLAQLGDHRGEPPEVLIDLVLERAEGNPFYLEELITFIAAQGVDPNDPAALRRLDLPDSLHSLVLSRIDTLHEGPRSTAKVASVIGRMFATPMLRGVYPDLGSGPEVARHLAALRRIGLIMLEQSVGYAVEETHLFKHVITAQAAYETTPAALREQLHERVGGYVEQAGEIAGAQIDLLAYHYGRSGNLGKKREYLLRAGDQARTDYANLAAIDYYGRLSPLLDGVERVPVLLHLGAVLELTGEWVKAETTYRDALELAERIDDQLGAHRVRKALAEVARKQGRYEEAGALLELAQAGFARLGDQAGVGEVLHLAGTLAAQQGAYGLARERYQASLEIRRELDDTEGMGALFSNLAIIAEYEGDLDQARELNVRALGLRLEIGNRWAIGVSQNNLGMIALLQADYAEAVSRFTETMRLNREVGDLWMVAIAHNNLGNALRGQDDLDQAAFHLGESLTGYYRFADRWALAILYEDIAALAAERGDADAAVALAGAAETLRDEIGSPRSPAQSEALDTSLAAARATLGDRSDEVLAAGHALTADAAYELARQVTRTGAVP